MAQNKFEMRKLGLPAALLFLTGLGLVGADALTEGDDTVGGLLGSVMAGVGTLMGLAYTADKVGRENRKRKAAHAEEEAAQPA